MLNPFESPAFQKMLLDMLVKMVPPHVAGVLQNPDFWTTMQNKTVEAYRKLDLLDEINARLERLENDDNRNSGRPTLALVGSGDGSATGTDD